MLSLFALCLSLQDTEVILRNHREQYSQALVEYDRALLVTESDPKQAFQTIERIFDNKKINTKDRRIQFERMGFQPARSSDFFPNQARGRIRLLLAKADPDNAAGLLSSAIVDLKASVDAGVKSSEKLLDDARRAQDRLKSAKPPEAPKDTAAEQVFREAWLKLIEDHKFKTARDSVDAKGAALGADKRREYGRDTEERCRKYVAGMLDEFQKAMELNVRLVLLRQMKVGEFNRQFALPAEAEVVGTTAELDWARKERPLLDKLRQADPRPREEEVAPLLESLINQTLATEPFERTGENRWFRVSGQMALRYAEEVIQALVAMSKDASPEKRQRCHEAAEKIRSKWSETLAKVPKDFLARNQINENPRRLAVLLEEFPVDAAELDHLDLDACFVSESPDSALEHAISDLTKIRDQQGARLSKESMRKLLTELVAATAAQDLLAGKSVEEVAKGLQELGRSLAQAGGALDPSRWGPKIERIFTALK